jgi:hypothetical protein
MALTQSRRQLVTPKWASPGEVITLLRHSLGVGRQRDQGWRVSSQTEMIGAGKFGSAKVPMATRNRRPR